MNFPCTEPVQYGDLVDLVMLDTRLEVEKNRLNNVLDPALYDCRENNILGEEQKDWFFEQLRTSLMPHGK